MSNFYIWISASCHVSFFWDLGDLAGKSGDLNMDKLPELPVILPKLIYRSASDTIRLTDLKTWRTRSR
jgi:hypothetical protein